ncbi:MAG: hypothetical protein Tsb0013_05290 [Phycisphaerales bacterium]
MTNVSHIPSTITTKAIRPATDRPSGLPSQLAPSTGVRPDDVRLSERALEAPPASSAPIRSDLVERVRADIEAGLYTDEAIDERLDAILPRIIEDLKAL